MFKIHLANFFPKCLATVFQTFENICQTSFFPVYLANIWLTFSKHFPYMFGKYLERQMYDTYWENLLTNI